jgi:lipid II:glycine glycyltransferase (peptidoglycan interpeptide bridge formation enzyme)
VELYNLQQMLAKMQTQLEQTHAETDDVSQQRVQAEEVLNEAKNLQSQVRNELATLKKQGQCVGVMVTASLYCSAFVGMHADFIFIFFARLSFSNFVHFTRSGCGASGA